MSAPPEFRSVLSHPASTQREGFSSFVTPMPLQPAPHFASQPPPITIPERHGVAASIEPSPSQASRPTPASHGNVDAPAPAPPSSAEPGQPIVSPSSGFTAPQLNLPASSSSVSTNASKPSPTNTSNLPSSHYLNKPDVDTLLRIYSEEYSQIATVNMPDAAWRRVRERWAQERGHELHSAPSVRCMQGKLGSLHHGGDMRYRNIKQTIQTGQSSTPPQLTPAQSSSASTSASLSSTSASLTSTRAGQYSTTPQLAQAQSGEASTPAAPVSAQAGESSTATPLTSVQTGESSKPPSSDTLGKQRRPRARPGQLGKRGQVYGSREWNSAEHKLLFELFSLPEMTEQPVLSRAVHRVVELWAARVDGVIYRPRTVKAITQRLYVLSDSPSHPFHRAALQVRKIFATQAGSEAVDGDQAAAGVSAASAASASFNERREELQHKRQDESHEQPHQDPQQEHQEELPEAYHDERSEEHPEGLDDDGQAELQDEREIEGKVSMQVDAISAPEPLTTLSNPPTTDEAAATATTPACGSAPSATPPQSNIGFGPYASAEELLADIRRNISRIQRPLEVSTTASKELRSGEQCRTTKQPHEAQEEEQSGDEQREEQNSAASGEQPDEAATGKQVTVSPQGEQSAGVECVQLAATGEAQRLDTAREEPIGQGHQAGMHDQQPATTREVLSPATEHPQLEASREGGGAQDQLAGSASQPQQEGVANSLNEMQEMVKDAENDAKNLSVISKKAWGDLQEGFTQLHMRMDAIAPKLAELDAAETSLIEENEVQQGMREEVKARIEKLGCKGRELAREGVRRAKVRSVLRERDPNARSTGGDLDGHGKTRYDRPQGSGSSFKKGERSKRPRSPVAEPQEDPTYDWYGRDRSRRITHELSHESSRAPSWAHKSL